MSGDPVMKRRTLLGGAVGGAVAAGVAAPALVAAPAAASSGGVDAASIDALAKRFDRDLVAFRRDLHAHPETAGNEQRTAAKVAERLRAAGLSVTTGIGGHGVVGVLRGAHRGRTVAYRADMDAVPPQAQFPSGTVPAHKCGHDLHTTVGVGVAEVLARLRHHLAGTLVFVFQPAEESLGGAAAMLADGVLGRFGPAEIHALHCGPWPVGHFGVMPGYGMPGQDHAAITLTGPGAEARASSLAGAISALGTVSPPSTSADMAALLENIETPNGPLATFVFMGAQAAGAEVGVSYRCWPEARYTGIREQIRVLANSYGPAQVIFPPAPFPAMVVPEREGQALAAFLRRKIGAGRVSRLHAAIPFNGEDFALFLNQIPGTYTFLGVRGPESSIEESYPHQSAFNPDVRAIGVGVRAMAHWLTVRT